MNDDELLAQLGDVLRDESPPQPSAERIAALRARAASNTSSDADVERRPAVAPTRRWWPAAAAAAVVVVIALIAGLVLADGDVGTVEYAGPMTGEGADAELSVVETGIGRVVTLRTGDLEILPTGEYYEVWFVAPDDTAETPNRISAGTFHPDPDGRSDVTFAAAVDPARYPIVEVTAEPGDGDPRPNGPVVLRTRIE